MAIIRIKLNTANPTVTQNMSIVVGDNGRVTNASRTIPIEAPPETSTWRGSRSVPSRMGSLVINQYYQSFEEEDVKRWNWNILADLAYLVEKQLAIVELSTVAQTATQIRALHVTV